MTISPGVVFRFSAGTWLTVEQGGSLTSGGTAAQPVIMTGRDKTPGFWNGVYFQYANSVQNALNYTVIEYGGGSVNSGASNLYAVGLSSSLARIKLNQVTLRESAGSGFGVSNNVVIDQFDGVLSTANKARPGYMPANSVGVLGKTSAFASNVNDTLYIEPGPVSTTQTWPRLDVPYQVGGSIEVNGALTLEPGTTLRFASSSYLSVNQGGSMNAVGTAPLPITFTGTQATPGFWDGLYFYYSNSASNELRHVVVEYGGAGSSKANVTVQGLSSSTGRVKMGNVTMRHSSGWGFSMDANSTIDEFSAMTVTLNGQPGTLPPKLASVLGPDSSYTGNTNDTISVFQGSVTQNQTWRALNVPLVLTGANNVTGVLTIEPGSRLIFRSGGALDIAQSGALVARGTVALPISFGGLESTPGYWRGIDFTYSNSTNNAIDHAVINAAGGGANGAIVLRSLSSSPARLNLTNSTVSNSATWGVYRDAASVFTQSGNTFTGNASGPVGP
jgi:hypothetical protein